MSFIVSPKLDLTNGWNPICSLLNVNPDQVAEKGEDEVRELPIVVANVPAKLGDYFDVEVNSLTANGHDSWPDLLFRGDFSNVFHIGSQMKSGKILVVGNAGPHTGSQMQGGEIRIGGDVGNFLGAEMTGGRIQVAGNVGDFVGGAYAGSKRGMNRGEILIGGDAGAGLGFRMRRGFILARRVGKNCGWQMRAGSIAFEQSQGPVGLGMVRGTIISLSPDCELPWAFSPSFVGVPPSAGLLANYIGRQNSSFGERLAASRFATFHGDHLSGGRGEVWVASQD